MKTLDEYPDAVREALAVHEMLRRCGFAADLIFVARSSTPDMLRVVLRAQGLQFVVECGPSTIAGSDEDFIRVWSSAVARYNAGASGGEIQSMLDQSQMFPRAVQLLAALHAKGFVLGPGAQAWARA